MTNARWKLAGALVWLLPGIAFVVYAVMFGFRDQSSLGEVFWFWGSVLSLICSVIPGVLVLLAIAVLKAKQHLWS